MLYLYGLYGRSVLGWLFTKYFAMTDKLKHKKAQFDPDTLDDDHLRRVAIMVVYILLGERAVHLLVGPGEFRKIG